MAARSLEQSNKKTNITTTELYILIGIFAIIFYRGLAITVHDLLSMFGVVS